MSSTESEGLFRLLLVNNDSPFDATVRLLSRYIPPGSKEQRQYFLGSVTSGHNRTFEVGGASNGEEVSVQISSDGEFWTPSNVFTTYTSSSLNKVKFLIKGTKASPKLVFDGFVNDSITTPVTPEAEHRKNIDKVLHKPIPKPSTELQSKFRWMQCVVQNLTQFTIVHDPPAYFDSGRYDTAPTNILPYDDMIFTVCNGDWTIGTGATGGTAFRIILDGVAEFPFALGWTTPAVGPYTAGVAASSKAEDGYNVSSPNGNAIKSEQHFNGTDENGKELKFRIEISASPAQKSMYVINQVRAHQK